MKIQRTTANTIMSRALQNTDFCLLAVMDNEEKTFFADSKQQMDDLLQTHQDATLVFNQNDQAQEYLDQLALEDGQQCIEIFQDTDGVFGLRAYSQCGKMQTPVTLELFD